MSASRNRNYFNTVWFKIATHKPVIRLFKDENLVEPHVVKDIGRPDRPFTLSRHKSVLGASRAINKYRRMIEVSVPFDD